MTLRLRRGAQRALATTVLTALMMASVGPMPALATGVPEPSPSTAPSPSPSATAVTSAPAPTPVPSTQPSPGPVDGSVAPSTAPSPSATSGVQPTPSAPAVPAAAGEAPSFVPTGSIGAKWAELGGATGPLGDATSSESCDSAGLCTQSFSGGAIYFHPASGAHAILSASGHTGAQWDGTGGFGKFGYPITDESCDGAGCFQRFSSGLDITWTAAGGYQHVWTRGAIGDSVYRVYGGYASIGYPTTPEQCNLKDGGCAQDFGRARILWSAATGAYAVSFQSPIGRVYTDSPADAGRLGYPLSKETCGLKAGGCYQLFQGGAIVWSPSTGAIKSWGAIRGRWSLLGYENGRLGYPLSDEACAASGCKQEYEGGRIYWSSGTGAYSVVGGIKSRFDSEGGTGGFLGYPLGDEVCNQPQGGCYQWFQGGLIFWSPSTGPQPVRGAIRSKYEATGWHWSYLGYPTAAEKCIGGECVQTFQGGYLTWTTRATADYRHTECDTLNDGRIKYPTGDAKHVTLTFAADYSQSYATVLYCRRVAGTYVADWKTDGRVGASGFKPPGVPSGPTRYNFSPTGSFSVTEAFGLGNPGTALPYRLLNPNSRWGGNPWTDTYNKYFESSSWVGWDENMWYFATGGSHDYRQGAVINYNRPPDSEIVQDAGFAIFLHEHKVPTAGCISLDDWAVEDFLRNSVPGDRIIMGVHRDIFR